MKTKKIPREVLDWVNSHKGMRTARHEPGQFSAYATADCSACWGQPVGGTRVGNYMVAVCQPSPMSQYEAPMFYYDYKPI